MALSLIGFVTWLFKLHDNITWNWLNYFLNLCWCKWKLICGMQQLPAFCNKFSMRDFSVFYEMNTRVLSDYPVSVFLRICLLGLGVVTSHLAVSVLIHCITVMKLSSFCYTSFLHASAMLKHVIAIGLTSVRLSVRPSHAGTLSKRLNILSCFLHHTIAHSF